MTVSIKIPEHKKKELQIFLNLPLETLKKLKYELDNAGSILPKSIHTTLSNVIDLEMAEVLVKNLIGLENFRREHSLNFDELEESLLLGIGNTNWSEEEKEKWKKDVSSIFVSLINTDAVCSVSKYKSLAYEHERILTSTKIVTDFRPVFNNAKEDFSGGIITQNFIIEFAHQNGKEQSISFALDKLDIELLAKECKEALTKADSLRTKLEKSGLEIYEPGKEKDDA